MSRDLQTLYLCVERCQGISRRYICVSGDPLFFVFAKPRMISKQTNEKISKAKTKLEVGFRILEQKLT